MDRFMIFFREYSGEVLIMEEKNLRSISQVSKGFWFNQNQSLDAARESLAQVAFLNLSSEQAHDQTIRLMLKKALHEGQAANQGALNHPFYRMNPEERFLLSALHYGQLSYQRIAQILNLSLEQISVLAAQSRLKLAFDLRISIPHAPQSIRENCPSYDSQAPWPERFLDEQIDEKHGTLQNHLMACPICQVCLSKYREYYYQIERIIPHLELNPRDDSVITGESKKSNFSELEQNVYELSKMIHQTRYMMNKKISVLQKSFNEFMRRKDVLVILAIFTLWTISKLLP